MPATLAAPARHEASVRHSRFLAHAVPVDTAAGALARLPQLVVVGATHNCWAYRAGADYRSSDDGEPAGSAGRPILAAIDGQGLDQVLVVVTRWYGGIKLGVGGLLRAYGGTASECLRTAARRPLLVTARLAVGCSFADGGEVHAAIAAFGAIKLAERFASHGVEFDLEVDAGLVEALQRRLRDATRNRVRIVHNGG